MAAFATAADMKETYDVRTLGDLVKDDGTRASAGDLTTDTILGTMLDRATGRIVGAIRKGNRYTRAQLEGLTGESADMLKDITCRVAFWLLWQRKPYSDSKSRVEAQEYAERILKALSTGEEIFEVDAAVDASGGIQITQFTRVQMQDENLVVDAARQGRFYPRRRTYKNT